jgi:hypothetical protein
MKALYSVVWGQCSEALRSKLKGNPDFTIISTNANSLELLKAIRSEMTELQKRQYLAHSVHTIMREFYQLSQDEHRSNQEYYDDFNNLVAAVDGCGAMLKRHPNIYNNVIEEFAKDASNPTPDERFNAQAIAKESYLAVAFLLGSDKARYGILVEEIEMEKKSKMSTCAMETRTQKLDHILLPSLAPMSISRTTKRIQRTSSVSWAKLIQAHLEWPLPLMTTMAGQLKNGSKTQNKPTGRPQKKKWPLPQEARL